MLYIDLTNSEARFTINVREGMVELEGKESFVDLYLEKFEEIFMSKIKQLLFNFPVDEQWKIYKVFLEGNK